MSRKVLIINPNTSISMTKDIKSSAEEYKLPDTEFTYVNPEQGPESIETYLDEFLSAIGVLKIITKEEENYDGFIIACGDDPGYFAAREITRKPIVPIGLSPMLIAPLLGRKFTILGTWPADKPRSEDKVDKYKLTRYLASVRPTGESVLGSHEDHEGLMSELEKQARLAIEEDGAEVLITTCAGLAGVHRELQNRLDVPVLEGVSCAVKLIELMIDYGTITTRVGQYQPLEEPKPLRGFKEFLPLDDFSAWPKEE